MTEHEQIQIVPPSPVPFSVIADQVQGRGPLGQPMTGCRVQIFTPAGLTVFFCEPEQLKKISQQLRMVANQAGSGLIIPAG